MDEQTATVSEPVEALRLNLGAGDLPLKGYVNLDGIRGEAIFPLEYVGCVDEIRASHVLEHFPHGMALEVLKNWAGALKPGGRLRVAVPDFKVIAERYLAGDDIDSQRYIMGGQVDKLDFHRTLYDEELLRSAMRAAGLRGIRHWRAEVQDCSALPISLNLEGFRALAQRPSVAAVLSVPRLGFMQNAKGLLKLPSMGIEVTKVSGAFWAPALTRAIEQTIAEYSPEWILTLDYDTLFNVDTVDALLELAARSPEADAICALQCNRGNGKPMFWLDDENGQQVVMLRRDVLQDDLVKVRMAHFGLTLLRVSKLRELPRPWFYGNPGPAGDWGNDRLDDDISFWHNWNRAGFSLYVAPRVPIGHLVEVGMWPDENLEPIYQKPNDFWATGAPERVWK